METNELLSQILTELRKLNAPKLGFVDPPTSCWIYANRSNGGLWYTIRDGNPEVIESAALTGYLQQIKFEKVTRRGKEVWKMQTFIRGDRPYCIESGYDSHFSKGLIAAIASLTPDQLRHPLTLMPQPGQDESVLFCRVFVAGEPVMASYGEDTNWRDVAQQAVSIVKAIAC